MKLKAKNNISFLENGGCFLYFFEKHPRCFLTNALLEANKIDIFDNDDEKNKLSTTDCLGDIKKCPYINILWDLNIGAELEEPEYSEEPEEPEKFEETEELPESGEETPLFNIGPLTIDFDYSWPQENPVFTDALLIPTDTSLNFKNFVRFDEDNDFILVNECKKRQLLFKVGDNIITHGANTGFPKIIHSIIMESGSLTTDIMSVGSALYNALSKAEDEGLKSIAISPFIKVNRDIIMPTVDLYLKACLTTILTFIEEYEINNLEYILIHIPPNFISNLQDVINDIDNIT